MVVIVGGTDGSVQLRPLAVETKEHSEGNSWSSSMIKKSCWCNFSESFQVPVGHKEHFPFFVT